MYPCCCCVIEVTERHPMDGENLTLLLSPNPKCLLLVVVITYVSLPIFI